MTFQGNLRLKSAIPATRNTAIARIRQLAAACAALLSLVACGSEPEYGRWTTGEGTCPSPEVDTVAFGSDFIEFHVAAGNRTVRIAAIVENNDGLLVVRFFNDQVEPYGTYVWTFRPLDDRRMERIQVELGMDREFQPIEGEPVIYYACP